MKKIFFLAALAFAGMMQAKTVTLDVNAPLNPSVVEYDANDVWKETYNEEDYYTIDFEGMSFSHLPSGESWDGYFWDGFTFSKAQDTTYAAMTDQFRCVAGGGLAGKGTPFLLGYAPEGWGPVSDCQVYFNQESTAEEVYLCIGSWALDNVLKGGGAARAFAQGDSLVIIVEGLDENFEVIEGKKVIFFLADYRSANEAEWTLNNGWEKCDLSSLGKVHGLVFTMKSSDSGSYGANTALYFALDGLKISYPVAANFENEEGGINLTTPESAWQGADAPVLGDNKWQSGDFTFTTKVADWGGGYLGYMATTVTNETSNAFSGYEYYRSAKGGAYEGANFAVWTDAYSDAADVEFAAQVVPGFFINNTAYDVNSMCNGDAYAKKFTAEDNFQLTISGYKEGVKQNDVVFYLAKDGEYVNEWTYVDLSSLGEIDALKFQMWGTDVISYDGGITYYLNTPAYFCMDNFGAEKPAGYVEPERAKFGDTEAVENVETGVKACKVLRNGQLIIVRGESEFTVTGQSIKE